MYYSTKAIILTSAPQGERGSQFILLTDEQGLIAAQGQGVLAPRSKLGPKLTPYRLLSLTLTRRMTDRIIGVEVLKTYDKIWSDARRQGYAAWANGMIKSSHKPGVSDQGVFALLLEYYELINESTVPPGDLPIIRIAFAVRLISLMGYRLVSRQPDGEHALRGALAGSSLKASLRALIAVQKRINDGVEQWQKHMGFAEVPAYRFLAQFPKQ